MHSEIGRLRAHFASRRNGSGHIALRLRMARLFGSMDLQPGAMSPSAILFVRHLSNPLPAYRGPWRDTARLDTFWERATRNALADSARRAARPSRNYVPDTAEAVLFADEGEMLACLSLDMSRGEAQARWWWRSMLRTLPSTSSAGLTSLLCSRATSVPATFYHLVQAGQAVTVVNTLSPEGAMTVLAAMGRAYAVNDIASHLVRSMEHAMGDACEMENYSRESHTPESVEVHLVHSATRWDQYTYLRSTVCPPWEKWLSPSSVPQGLRKENHCLLGVGLTLYHEPAVVRTSRFLQTFHDWWLDNQQISSARTKNLSHGSSPFTDKQEFTAIAGEVTVGQPIQDSLERTPLSIAQSSAFKKDSFGEGPTLQDDETLRAEHGGLDQKNRIERTENKITAEKYDKSAKSIGKDGRPRAASGETREQEPPASLAEGVNTQLGGVLYLINLMYQLDLLARFEEEWGLASQIGAWGVLDVLGRALLGPNKEDFAEDPLWQALAELDGRSPGTLPITDLYDSEHYYLPPNWSIHVRTKTDGVCYWATQNHRLRVWFENDYLVFDGPRNRFPPEVQAREAFGVYFGSTDSIKLSVHPFIDEAPVDPLISPLVKELKPNLTRWLALVLPFIRFSLQRALKPVAPEKSDLGKTFLTRRGRLYVTSTHVDLVMNLNDISVPVRLAGLDRNPGWAPDFGRVVLFHFE